MKYTTEDVTIIIPVYCVSDDSLFWLKECLESVKDQGCEIVVYDDGSPISVAPIVSRYNVTKFVVSSKNRGVSVARNRCVELVKTELIFPLDCDDTLTDDAIRGMLEEYDGTPLYPDVCNFGEESVPHYALLNFHCDHIYNFVGFTSVNVLHKKSQWKKIGGWDHEIDFYEDGEYNARLLGNFCGQRYPHPIVNYRIHSNQRTKQYKKVANTYAKKLMAKIRSYDMACCGKRSKKTPQKVYENVQKTVVTVEGAEANLPMEFEGKVLVRYIGGKGRGPHYYKPVKGERSYKVKFGEVLYVDPQHASHPSDPTKKTFFIRIIKTEEKKIPVKSEPTPVVKEEKIEVVEDTSREPVKVVERTPVDFGDEMEIPDIQNLNYREVKALDMDEELAKVLLNIEENGRNRKSVKEYLERYING